MRIHDEGGVYGLKQEDIDTLIAKGGLCHRAFFNFGVPVENPLQPGQVNMAIQSGAAACCGKAGLCALWDHENKCCLDRTKLLAEIQAAKGG